MDNDETQSAPEAPAEETAAEETVADESVEEAPEAEDEAS